MSFSDSLFQYLDSFSVRQANEWVFQDPFQTSDQFLIEHIVQELDILHTVIQRPLYAIFNELLGQLHIVRDIIKSDFRLNHPEFRQMTRRIWVLSAERRAKRINLSQGCSCQLTLQLSGNRQASLLAEEIVLINDRAILILFQVVQIFGSNLEHLSGTLTVGSRDDRRMEIEKASIMEKLMDSVSHIVTNTEYRAKCIRTRTQVSDLT